MELLQKIMPIRMSKIRIMLLEEHLEDLLKALQDRECIHLININDRIMKWENLVKGFEPSLQELNKWERIRARLIGIIDELDLDPEPGFLDQFIKPLERKLLPITHQEEEQLLEDADKIIDRIRHQITSIVDRYMPIRQALDAMTPPDFDIDLIKSSESITVFVGTVASEHVSTLERELIEQLPSSRLYSEGKGRSRYLVVTSLNTYGDNVKSILDRRGFQVIEVPEELKGATSHTIRWIDDRVTEVKNRNRETVYRLYDSVIGALSRLEVKERLGRTEKIVVIEGWTPEHNISETTEKILDATEGLARILVTKPDEPEENIPTLLTGPFSSFSTLVETYDIPRYNEVDPSGFMALFFTVFVGLMIGDIALGVLVALAGYLFYRGAGSRGEGMRHLSKVVVASGISSIIFGALTGSFMSGVLEQFSGGTIKLPSIILSPADDPLGFIPIVLMIGIFQISVGIIIGLVNNLINERYRNIIGDQVSATLLLLGALIILVTGQFNPVGWGLVGYGLIAGGVITLVIGHGAQGLLELTNTLSNLISYIRLLALNMATTWMGRTFVLLAAMILPIRYVGLPLALFLLTFSQFFLVFISSFSTFAHALRLHYVEFFGRFFMGGGIKYNPLKVERKYTYINSGEK